MAKPTHDEPEGGRELEGNRELDPQGNRDPERDRKPQGDHDPEVGPAPIVLSVDPLRPDPATIRRAADILRAGGLVAFPTETVYGLGANALDPAAVARIFVAKGRPADDPLIVHILESAALAPLVTLVPSVAVRLAEAFWPGPLTLVLPRSGVVPDAVTAGFDTVAVRAPSHPVARALIRAAGTPIAAPSANPFGRTSPTTAAHVVADLGGRVDVVLDGGSCTIGVESTVVDCTTEPPRVLRHGGVSLEDLRAIVPDIVDIADGEHSSIRRRSPGTYERHYAPRARLVLVIGPRRELRDAVLAAAERLDEGGGRVGLLLAEEDLVDPEPERPIVRVIGSLEHPEDAARDLFAGMRELDAEGATIIIARDFGSAGLGRAVRDRLSRAAEGRIVEVEAGRIEKAVAAIIAFAGVDRP